LSIHSAKGESNESDDENQKEDPHELVNNASFFDVTTCFMIKRNFNQRSVFGIAAVVKFESTYAAINSIKEDVFKSLKVRLDIREDSKKSVHFSC
jgi:hypothetical protein